MGYHGESSYEPCFEKTGLRGFRPGSTQTGCSFHVAKTKALISFAVTAKLICVFVFAYAKIRFSHNEAQIHILSAHEGQCKYSAELYLPPCSENLGLDRICLENFNPFLYCFCS